MDRVVTLAVDSLLLTMGFVALMLKARDQDPELEEVGKIGGLLNALMFLLTSFWIQL